MDAVAFTGVECRCASRVGRFPVYRRTSMYSLSRGVLILAAVVLATTAAASPARASGQIDASTLRTIRHGTYSGVPYARYEAMFEGVTSNKRPYRVPGGRVTCF